MSVFLWMLSLAAVVQGQQAPAPCLLRPENERAYSKQRLMAVVRDQTPARAEFLIRTCGVKTPWSADLEIELRSTGATEGVIEAVKAKAPTPPPTPHPPKAKPPEGPKAGEVRENPKDGLRYVYIPAGTFQMGCSPDDTDCLENEKPREVKARSTAINCRDQLSSIRTYSSCEPIQNQMKTSPSRMAKARWESVTRADQNTPTGFNWREG